VLLAVAVPLLLPLVVCELGTGLCVLLAVTILLLLPGCGGHASVVVALQLSSTLRLLEGCLYYPLCNVNDFLCWKLHSSSKFASGKLSLPLLCGSMEEDQRTTLKLSLAKGSVLGFVKTDGRRPPFCRSSLNYCPTCAYPNSHCQINTPILHMVLVKKGKNE
jgi:hypothetical protein